MVSVGGADEGSPMLAPAVSRLKGPGEGQQEVFGLCKVEPKGERAVLEGLQGCAKVTCSQQSPRWQSCVRTSPEEGKGPVRTQKNWSSVSVRSSESA